MVKFAVVQVVIVAESIRCIAGLVTHSPGCTAVRILGCTAVHILDCTGCILADRIPVENRILADYTVDSLRHSPDLVVDSPRTVGTVAGTTEHLAESCWHWGQKWLEGAAVGCRRSG